MLMPRHRWNRQHILIHQANAYASRRSRLSRDEGCHARDRHRRISDLAIDNN